jgi:hypothetical protein
MIVLIVFLIVKLVQMQHPAILANQQPYRINHDYYLFVIVLKVPIHPQILIVLIVYQIAPLAQTELNAPPVKTH